MAVISDGEIEEEEEGSRRVWKESAFPVVERGVRGVGYRSTQQRIAPSEA